MTKNKHFIILIILIIGLIAIFGSQKFAFSGGGGGGGGSGTGEADCMQSQEAMMDGVGPGTSDSAGGDGSGDGGGGDGGGGWNYGSPPTLTFNAPSIVEFPDPISLSWQSQNTTSCTASLDWSGSKPVSGNQSISKSVGIYTFRIDCSGSGGTVFDTKTTRVIQVPRGTFTANPGSIIPPEASTLSWEIQYAYSCFIDNEIGPVDASGSIEVRPYDTTTYTLICDGLDDQRSFNATVSVGFLPWLKEILPK